MYTTGSSACLKLLKGLGYLKQTCQKSAQASSSTGCVRTVASLTHLLSGAPCRLPPGSAGQRCAGMHLLHPGHLRVCGSALHPQQRKEVHHLRHLSGPGLWVFLPSAVLSCSLHFCPCWCPLPPFHRPVHHDCSLHLHRSLPPGWEAGLVRPLLHPGVDLLRADLHLLHHLLCATQEDGLKRTLVWAPASPEKNHPPGSALSAKNPLWY